MSGFPAKGLRNLARRIVAGEVVFFIGAGFSIDSEGNSAACLIRCLLARFLAITEILQGDDVDDEEIRNKARDLRQSFCNTFWLEGDSGKSDEIADEKNIKKLAQEYYHINDWMTSAFADLLEAFEMLLPGEYCKDHLLEERREIIKKSPCGKLLKAVSRRENALLGKLEKTAGWFERRGLPLEPIDFALLLELEDQARGKALFLDTMGFNDPDVMTGSSAMETFADVEKSCAKSRLKPRHEVLAWLAREGLCPTLVTTNYDLLLEGAYRLAGLKITRSRESSLLPSSYDDFSLVSNAGDFFTQGSGFKSALIVKLHGCTDLYRRTRNRDTSGTSTDLGWESYLPAMVFTFREIQNWREDSWSRDFLRTLLRTRTLVFAGYSGIDPVIHDTFRTVYEEMARYREKTAEPRVATDAAAVKAPAFFFRIAGHEEFHGMEILRAASAASGLRRPPLTDHPNLLPFHRCSEPGDSQLFPTLDQSMLWLFHLVFRIRQWQVLTTHLRRAVAQALGHPGAEADITAVRRSFRALCLAELRAAQAWARKTDDGDHQRQLEHIVGWTSRFHPAFIRELALAEAVLRHQGPGSRFRLDDERRRKPYQSIGDHQDWAAWGVVVELAVRKRIAAWRECADTWQQTCDWVRVGRGEQAQVYFARDRHEPTPIGLTFRVASFDRVGQAPAVDGLVRRHDLWHVYPEALPWPNESFGSAEELPLTPRAEKLWTWARQSPQEHHVERLEDWPETLDGGGHG